VDPLPIVDVDLSRPPGERWEGLRPFVPAIRELTEMFERDLARARPFREMIEAYRDQQDGELLAELDGIARMAEVDALDLFLVNAYYDVFKHAMGCTAFALDTDEGPLHARNLDWHSENGALSRHTIVVRYLRGEVLLFTSVTWPGFIGALSGLAPGRFSVTLNAVLSLDPAEVATPVSFVLRDLLTRASYDEALAELTHRTLSGDCLLLVVGTEPGQMRVTERSPRRAAVREPEAGLITVTNDYRALSEGTDVNELAAT
jgi:acid ceramidase